MNVRNPFPDSYLSPADRSVQMAAGLSGTSSNDTTLLAYLKLILARKWLVVFTTLLAVILAAVIVTGVTPVYRATATVLVESGKNQITSIDQIYSAVTANREYYQTQAEFVKSRDVSARVVRRMKLVENPHFDPARKPKTIADTVVGSVRNVVNKAVDLIRPSNDLSPVADADSDQKAIASLVQELQSNLNVNLVRLSQLIRVSYESTDPKLAAEIANTIADEYIRADIDTRFDVTRKASKWLAERLEELRVKLEESELDLQSMREAAGIVDTRRDSLGGNAKQIDAASQRLVQARITRSRIEQVYRQVRKGARDRFMVPQVFNNPAVVRAREEVTRAETVLQDVRQQLGSAHPAFVKAEANYRSAQLAWQRQAEGVINSIAKEYQVARGTERALERQIATAGESIKEITRKELSLDRVERDVKTNRQLYQTFLARVKETNATSDFQTPIARISDPAIVPLRPFKPAKSQIVLLSGLGGLLLGSILALLLERSSRTIKASDDVLTRLEQPLIAAVPLVPALRGREAKVNGLLEPNPLFDEAVRTALTSIQLATLDIETPVIALTSSVPAEGKSNLAMHLATEAARTKRVLLIDADLRRPSIALKLGLDPVRPGLAELIAGTTTGQESIAHLAKRNLAVLCSGKARKNPLDLLLSDRFAECMSELRNQFDMIIVDTPPIELVSDALLIARQCTGVAYVVKSESTQIATVRRGLERAEAVGIRVFGVVLNAHDFARAGSYYGESSAHAKYAYEYKST